MKKTFHLSPGQDGMSEDVRREIELHLELRAREFEAQGMSPADARQAALAAFGDRGAIEAEVRTLRSSTVKDKHRREFGSELSQDIKLAIRGLVRAPGFALVACLTLALGIGANSAIFSVVRSVLLRPLPYPESDRLVQIWADHRSKGRVDPEWLTPPQFKDWQANSRSFSSMAAYQGWAPDLTGDGEPESLGGAAVSWNFFDVYGVAPALGRSFVQADDDAGAERVIVISDGLWRRRFGADPAVIGKQLQLNGEPWTLIGVLPGSFRPTVVADVWRPTRRPADSRCGRGCIVVRAIGRLKPGVTVAQAKADLAAVQDGLGKLYPETDAGIGAWPIALHQQVTGKTRPALLALTGAVLLVLLIGCVNLANLLLLRGAARARELSVRAALGAGRGRLVRQLLTETGVLAVIGGAGGLLLGWWGSRLLAAIVPNTVSRVLQVRLDGVVVLFTAGITLVAAIIFGLLPALHAARSDLMSALRAGKQDPRGGHRLRESLVVAELTISVVLLVGAGLLGRSFLAMQRVDMGFRTDSVVMGSVLFPRSRYPESPRAVAAITTVLERLNQDPAITAAAVSDQPPLLGGGDQDIDVTPVGEAASKPFDTWYRTVTPGYIELMKMKVVAGRSFSPSDRTGAPFVGILNEEAARKMFPGKSAIGRQVQSSGQQLTVVGVVVTGRPDGPNTPVKMEIFLPLEQFPTQAVTFMLDPRRDVAAAAAALKTALAAVDPDVALSPPPTMAEQAGEAVALPRLYALLVGIFASAALALAVLGVYGVMAHAVAQRQREIGVRLALGAAPGTIRGLILGRGTRLTLVGLALGLVGAAAAGRLIGGLLFGVAALDVVTFSGVVAVLAVMSLLACLLPAQRAMRVDPLVAIREE